jgi:(1->4)-alpha-D-glucan 1-alpha-D-glucosylmutase
MNLVSAVQHNPSGEAELTNLCTSLTGRPADFDIEEAAARHELLHDAFTAQLDRTASAFHRIAIADPATRDISLTALRRGLVRVITHMRAYRSYATGRPDGAAPGAPFDRAIAAAKQAAPQDAYVFDFVAQTQGASNTADAVRRFNQLTAPVTAKAVEDTAFYRYGRLLSRNDIGFDPRQFALPADDFHAAIARRAATHPNAMLATATHDHKRGEDVRARLAALSNHPTEWRDSVASWFTLNAPRRPEGLAPDDEYQLYQTLVGAWPLDLAATDTKAGRAFATRVMKWQQKALREAKLRSSWTAPNTGYEDAAKAFTAAVLEAPEFLAALEAFVGRIAHEGAMNGLMQVVLRMTLPGVPDLYQGTEFWDFSLVDPDNRRPVDYEARTSALSSDADLLATWRDGRIKQSIIRRLLALRRSDPEFFALADYQPMALDGNTVAFTRRHAGKTLIVAAPARPLHAGDLATVLSEPALVLWGPA